MLLAQVYLKNSADSLSGKSITVDKSWFRANHFYIEDMNIFDFETHQKNLDLKRSRTISPDI